MKDWQYPANEQVMREIEEGMHDVNIILSEVKKTKSYRDKPWVMHRLSVVSDRVTQLKVAARRVLQECKL